MNIYERYVLRGQIDLVTQNTLDTGELARRIPLAPGELWDVGIGARHA